MATHFLRRIGVLQGSLLGSALLLTVVLALALGWASDQLGRYLVTQESSRIEHLVADMQARLSDRVEGAPGQLAAEVEALRRLGGLRYVEVRDESGRVLATDGGPAALGLPHADLRTALAEGMGRYDLRIDLLSPGRRSPVGALRISVDLAALQDTLALVRSAALALGVLIVVMHVALVRWVLSGVLEGVSAIEARAVALRRAEDVTPMTVRGDDAIARLTRAFNQMVQALDERVTALRKSESRFHAIADYTFGVEAWFSPQGRLIWVNRSIERVTGHSPLDCLLAEDLASMLIHEKDRRIFAARAQDALAGASGENFEVRLLRRDGSIVWVSLNWQPIYDEAGVCLGVRVSADDIQSRKEAELKLLDTVTALRREQGLRDYYLTRSEEERSRLEALLDLIKLGVLFVDRDGRAQHANRMLKKIWGFDDGENLSGMRDAVLIERTAQMRMEEDAYREHVREVLSARSATEPHDILLKDGRIIREQSALVPASASGRFLGRVWLYEDVTAERRAAEALVNMAERDPLTNLFNRRRFHEELDRMIADAGRRRTQLGLLLFDLDGFKPVNDRFGHQAGDEVLVRLARDVGAVVRRNEMFFRLGGDEFAVLAPDTDEAALTGLARRIGERVASMAFEFGGQSAQVTTSTGIGIYPSHAQTGEALLSAADSAMYAAKNDGKNAFRMYDRRHGT
ncbi:sensor domain-containing diguanylate cyclase [Methyloversatilis thermotolerans]|uniref:sensor domain-containing diguanylate cyclase n=1 Tax=Methyloversatilis thermotolerans TaxID=1346290 RepID=UPI00036CE1C4|nr:diguanylate cyclase [Methyloversatilis thermotolerans]